MIPKSMASGFDPMGGNRLSDKIMLKTKNLDRDPISIELDHGPATGRGRGVGGRSRGQVSVLMFDVPQACSGIETHLGIGSRGLPLFST